MFGGMFSNIAGDVNFATIGASDSPEIIEKKLVNSINNVQKKIKQIGGKIEDINNKFVSIEAKTQKALLSAEEAEGNIIEKIKSVKGGKSKGNIEILAEVEKGAHFILLRKKRLKDELVKLDKLIYGNVDPKDIIPISKVVDNLLIDRDRLEKKIETLKSSISI